MKITCIFRRFDYYRQAWFFPGINFIKKSGENSRTAFLSLFFALCKEYVPRSKFSTYLWPTFCAGERTCSSTSKNWRELFFQPFYIAYFLHVSIWRVFVQPIKICQTSIFIDDKTEYPFILFISFTLRKIKRRESKTWNAMMKLHWKVTGNIFIRLFLYELSSCFLFSIYF